MLLSEQAGVVAFDKLEESLEGRALCWFLHNLYPGKSMCACWEGLNVKFWSGSCKDEAAPEGNGAIESESHTPAIISEAPFIQRMSTCSNEEISSLRPCSENGLQENSTLRIFTYKELKVATRNFRPNNALGEGGFGTVYKGFIDDIGQKGVKTAANITVAVKVLNQEGSQGHREWLAEVNVLGQLRHPHLVRLMGYCCEKEHRLLVYEYMPQGSLEDHLFQKTALPLPWATRMKIAYGAAKGLAFLHEAEKAIIYRDFKTSNILLESDYTARLSDFGLAKDGPEGDQTHVSTRVMGTHGYAAPEYVMTGHLTARSDVYSFGVVLVELLTGRHAIDKTRPSGEHSLVEWARPYLRDKRKFLRIIDPMLDGIYPVRGAHKTATLASHCLRHNPKERPLMSSVVEALELLQNMRDVATTSYTFVAGSGIVDSMPQFGTGVQ